MAAELRCISLPTKRCRFGITAAAGISPAQRQHRSPCEEPGLQGAGGAGTAVSDPPEKGLLSAFRALMSEKLYV